jgi:hypothetical protein
MTPVEKLEAIEEIRQTKCRYLRCTDTKDWAGLRTVFCADASLGDDLAMVQGADAVVEAIRQGTEGMTMVHHGHNSEVWIDSADTAHAISAFEDLGFNAARELKMHGYGRYHETYRREDGAWKILECKVYRLTIVDNGPVSFHEREKALS